MSQIGEGSGNPLQYSCLENPMDGGAWWTVVHGVAKSQTWNNGLVQNWERSMSKLYLSPCLFNFYAEYIMRNTRLDEAQLELRLLGEISITSDMQMTPPLWQKAKEN